jgi:hypothetical protein
LNLSETQPTTSDIEDKTMQTVVTKPGQTVIPHKDPEFQALAGWARLETLLYKGA